MIEQTLPKELWDMASVQQELEKDLLAMQNVVGVALGHKIKDGQDTKHPCISVLVTHKEEPSLLSLDNRVPSKLKDFPTDVVEIGPIFANEVQPASLGEPDSDGAQFVPPTFSSLLRRRMRPAPGGFSVSLAEGEGGTGTIATGCYDANPFPGVPDRYYILSNNHVLADSNNAPLGADVIQPGGVDGGRLPGDFIAKLSRFISIRFISGEDKPYNLVDAAIAECDLQDIDRAPFWIGPVKRLVDAHIDGVVRKSGRTTGFTTGRVTNLNATCDVDFGMSRIARFSRQIVTTNMSQPGDSGSLVTDLDEGAVGLLFAGTTNRTIVNNISLVQKMLAIRITEK